MLFRPLSRLTAIPAATLLAVLSGVAAGSTLDALSASRLNAQAVIVPGDAAVDGSRIKAGTTRFRISATRDGETNDFGTYSRETTPLTVGGRSALRIVQKFESDMFDTTDTTIVELKTLKPISKHGHTPDGPTIVEYSDRELKLQSPDADHAVKTITKKLLQPGFDGASLEVLLAALPLKTGYSAKIPTLPYGKADIEWNTVKVAGERTIDGVAAWDVSVAGSEGVTRFAVNKADGGIVQSQYMMMGNQMTMTPVKK